MKTNILYILLIIVNFLNAQPGSQHELLLMQRQEEFDKITDSLSKNPKNYELIWERTQLLFDPYFNMYKKSNEEIEDDVSLRFVFSSYQTLQYKNIDILNEVNKLIVNVDTLKNLTRNDSGKKSWVNKSNFYYKRGQYYYLKNELKKSLADYQTALNYYPDDNTKKRICISIAAYYYNHDWNFGSKNSDFHSKLNLEKALEYIDMVSPQFDKEICDFSTSQAYLISSFSSEQEKLELLKI